MKKTWFMVVLISIAFSLPIAGLAAEPAEEPVAWGGGSGGEVAPVPDAVPVTAELVSAATEAKAGRILFRERRQLREAGLTVRNMARTARDLKDQGVWEKGDTTGNAVLIVGHAVQSNPEGFFDNIDIDRLIELIERLMPLIEIFMIFLS